MSRNAAGPQARLEEILERVGQGRRELAQGTVTDLSSLESEVQTLCEAVLSLSPQERENYAAALEALHRRLGEFGEELMEARELLRQQIGEMTSHKKASVAYKTADSRDDFGRRGSAEGDGEK